MLRFFTVLSLAATAGSLQLQADPPWDPALAPAGYTYIGAGECRSANNKMGWKENWYTDHANPTPAECAAVCNEYKVCIGFQTRDWSCEWFSLRSNEKVDDHYTTFDISTVAQPPWDAHCYKRDNPLVVVADPVPSLATATVICSIAEGGTGCADLAQLGVAPGGSVNGGHGKKREITAYRWRNGAVSSPVTLDAYDLWGGGSRPSPSYDGCPEYKAKCTHGFSWTRNKIGLDDWLPGDKILVEEPLADWVPPGATRAPGSAQPGPDANYTNIGKVTWQTAVDKCAADGKQLCSYSDYCPGDASGTTPLRGVLSGDVWAPIADSENDWVQIGDGFAEPCRKHSRFGAGLPPAWGAEDGIYGRNGPILCCCPSGASCFSSSYIIAAEGESAPASSSSSAARGDPHLMNLKGEAFDVMQTGNMMLLEIPRGSSPATLDLALHADIERLGLVSCGPTFITSASFTGRWIGVPLEIRSGPIVEKGRHQPKHTFGIRLDGQDWLPHGAMEKTLRLSTDATLETSERMFLFQVRGLDIAVSQPKRPRTFLDIQVKGLGNLKTEIGGLLGIDDHSSVEEVPAECGMSESSLSLVARMEEAESLQWSARALL